MKVEKIQLINFRNYENCILNFAAPINILYGKNAQGKTNILEAMYFSAFGTSHRTKQEDELIMFKTDGMSVLTTFIREDGKNEIKIKKFSDVGLRKKEIHLNGKKTTAKNHYGSLNMIMFSPEDLQIVKGDPSLRRKFLDMEIAQTNRIYYELLVKYNKNLKQRNKLLKEIKEQKANISLLDPWNEEISTLAAQILIIRIENLKKLNTLANSIYNNITANKENLIIKYELKANNGELIYPEEKSLEEWKDFYKESLKARVDKDVYRGYTAIGPHRDDLNICIDDFSVRSYGSQGQQRSCALALKFSQIEYIYDQIGEYPVLLLDDVMSELDHFRREQILNFISNKVQTFITVNDKSLIPLIPDSEFFEVENGVIKEAEHE